MTATLNAALKESLDPAPGSELDPAADPAHQVDELTAQVRQLEASQGDLVLAQLRQLRDLAVLNKASEALGSMREPGAIIAYTLVEASNIMSGTDAWLIEPDAVGAPRLAYDREGKPIPPQELPPAVLDVFSRALALEEPEGLLLPEAGNDGRALTAARISSPEQVVGVLVLETEGTALVHDSQPQRLMMNLLHQSGIACQNARLIQTLSGLIVDVAIAMALAIESRDPYTGGHVMRVTAYALLLAGRAGLGSADKARLRLGGMLHDIGKVAVPDAILRKPGRLDDDEMTVMKTHAAVGHQIISPIPQLAPIAPIVRSHHERFDGKGYPDGLAGEGIDLLARVAAIADTYDAMTSDRPYRKGLAVPVAMAEVRKMAGTQFDPDLAAHFVGLTAEELLASVEEMKRWREGDRGSGTHDLLGLIQSNARRPRNASASAN